MSAFSQKVRARAAELASRLDEELVLVRFSFSRWKGGNQIKEAKVSVGEVELDNKATGKTPWSLVPPEWNKTINIIDTQYKDIVETYSTSGMVIGGGVHAVPVGCVDTVFDLIDELRKRLADTVEGFCSNGGQEFLKEDIKSRVGDAYEAAMALVPSPDELKRKFGIRCLKLPVRLAASVADERNEIDAESNTQVISDLVEAAIAEPRRMLAQSLRELANAVYPDLEAAPGKKTSNTKQNMFESRVWEIDRVLRFGKFIDANLRKDLETLRGLLDGVDCKAINADADRAMGLAELMGSIADDLVDEDSMVRGLEAFLDARAAKEEVAV